jgi:hypothetical protein
MGKGIAGSPRLRSVSERMGEAIDPVKVGSKTPRGPHRPMPTVVGPPRPTPYRSQNT